jgi:hypothetical protein
VENQLTLCKAPTLRSRYTIKHILVTPTLN